MRKSPMMKKIESHYNKPLEDLLNTWIWNLTQEEITEKIITESGIYVTQGTISNWCRKFDIKLRA